MLAALALVLAVAAAAVAAFVLTMGSGLAIDGPRSVEAGESITLLAQDTAAVSFLWSDSDGNESSGAEFELRGVVPGEVEVRVEAIDASGASRVERATIDVTESPDGPVIVGPERVRVGDTATFGVAETDATSVTWVDSAGITTSDRYEVSAVAAGAFRFSVIVVRPDGERIGSTKVVEFVE